MTLESKLRALLAKVPHVYVDGPNCGWLDNSGTACGKSHDQGRHIRYGPQEEYLGYHHFEAEQVHDKSKCPTCQLEALLAERQPHERFVSREEFNNSIADEAAQSCVDWGNPERRKEALRYIVKQVWNEALAERQPVCIGYPGCDGDLEGEPHSEKCLASVLAERQPVERIVSREEFNNGIADEAAQSCVDWSNLECRKEALRYIIKQVWNEALAERQEPPLSKEAIDRLLDDRRFIDRLLGVNDKTMESLLRDANEKLRSAYQIARRQGRNTNWGSFENRVHESLVRQHVILWPKEPNEAAEHESGTGERK